MRWKGRRQSQNVEDRRGARTGTLAVGGVGGAVGLVILIIVVLLGGDPQALLEQMPQQPAGAGGNVAGPAASNPEEDELAAFVSVVLADTEDV